MSSLDVSSAEFLDLSPFDQLVAIMAALRGPGGCPWDLEQTPRSLTPFLLEEACECIEAIEGDDPEAVREELGDVLLQVVFHAQLASEQGRFDAHGVCRAIVDKMIRRHPHVFGEAGALQDAGQVLTQWEQIKKAEKGEPGRSILDGVAQSLPALPQSALIQDRARRSGFRYAHTHQAWDKLREELDEFRDEPTHDELGDVLFAAVSLASMYGLDPEAALRSTNRKFRRRFAGMEKQAGGNLTAHTPEQLKAMWQELARQEWEASHPDGAADLHPSFTDPVALVERFWASLSSAERARDAVNSLPPTFTVTLNGNPPAGPEALLAWVERHTGGGAGPTAETFASQDRDRVTSLWSWPSGATGCSVWHVAPGLLASLQLYDGCPRC